MFAVLTVFVLAVSGPFVPAFGVRSTVSPVQKVVQLLEDFQAKTVEEGKVSQNSFAEYARWCDDEADAKTQAIKDTKEEMSDLQATMSDCEGTINSLETKISELTTSIAATEEELSKAKNRREDSHKTFLSAERELSDSVATLGKAFSSIKKAMGGAASLAQMPEAKRTGVRELLNGLKSVVESGWLSTQQKTEIKAFLQEKAEADDEDDDMEPLQSKSDGVMARASITTQLSDMQDKAEESLASERKQEMKDLNAFQLLKMALSNEIKDLKSELAGSTSRMQATKEELASAKKGLESAEKSLEEDQAYFRDLKHDCQARAAEFEVEYKDRAAEVAVLNKAKSILTAKFSSFLQTGARVRVVSASSTYSSMERTQGDVAKEQALKIINRLGKSMGSTVLISLSYRALADPFGKVKSMIEEMIEKLLQEAAEEAEGKAFCDKELGETKNGIANKNEKLDKVNARIEKAESMVEKLTEEVSILTQELAENDKAIGTATTIRGDERQAFRGAAKDYAESQQACAAAIEVLRGYYDSGSFIQIRMKTRTKAKAAAEESTEDGSAIIGLLEVAESDFSKLLAEAKAVEEAAQEEFAQMSNDAKLLKATKSTEIKAKKTQIASIKDGLMDFSSDKDGLGKELDALVAYNDKLKPQCTVQVPSYEERKQRREKEIDGLKDALSVLEGNSIP